MYFFPFMFNTVKFQSCSLKKRRKKGYPQDTEVISWNLSLRRHRVKARLNGRMCFFSELNDQVMF